MRSGEEYEEMAGVAGTDGDGEEARTGSDKASSIDCGSSMTCEVAERILKPQLSSHQARGCLNGQSLDRRLLACALSLGRGCSCSLGRIAGSDDEVLQS